jgi:hypothetical protein
MYYLANYKCTRMHIYCVEITSIKSIFICLNARFVAAITCVASPEMRVRLYFT